MTITLATPTNRHVDLASRIRFQKPENDNAGKLRGMDDLKAFAKMLRQALRVDLGVLGDGYVVSVRCSWSTHTPSLTVAFTIPGTIYTTTYAALRRAGDWQATQEYRTSHVLAGGSVYNALALSLRDAAEKAIKPVHRDDSDLASDYHNVNFFYDVQINGTSL